MSASCRECKRQVVVILEGVGGKSRRAYSSRFHRARCVAGAEGKGGERPEDARGRGPVTSPATLSTDLGQRVVRFIYMHAVERGSAFLLA